jgi:hypothetical protein
MRNVIERLGGERNIVLSAAPLFSLQCGHMATALAICETRFRRIWAIAVRRADSGPLPRRDGLGDGGADC